MTDFERWLAQGIQRFKDEGEWHPATHRVTRKVTTDECPWLTGEEATLQPGQLLFACTKPTYGCIGPSGRAMTFDPAGGYPFFEFPIDALESI